MNRRFLRALYLLVKYVPLFDEGLAPLFHIKSSIFGLYLGAKGPLAVARYANVGQSHDNPDCFLRIGTGVEIREMVIVDYTGGLEIGDDVTVSAGAKIYTHNHQVWDRDARWRDQPITFSSLHIGADTWIGANAVILPGVSRIGQGAIIGAGSVVTHDVLDYAVVVGNPARVIGQRVSSAPLAGRM